MASCTAAWPRVPQHGCQGVPSCDVPSWVSLAGHNRQGLVGIHSCPCKQVCVVEQACTSSGRACWAAHQLADRLAGGAGLHVQFLTPFRCPYLVPWLHHFHAIPSDRPHHTSAGRAVVRRTTYQAVGGVPTPLQDWM
eukprot:362223-Chlamydomonas_euryale.AAC.2